MTASAAFSINAETLASIALFRHLPLTARQQLAQRCHCRHFDAEQQIVAYLDNSHDVFFIVSGRVSVTVYSHAGRQVIFQSLEAGETFGELSAIDNQPRSAYVLAVSDCIIGQLSASDFMEAIYRYPEVTKAVLRHLSNMVRRLCERMYEVCTLPVRERVHAELLRLAMEHSGSTTTAVIAPAPTHAEIACRIGTHREAVTRELTELRQTGLVMRSKGALIVNNIPQLTRLVNHHDAIPAPPVSNHAGKPSMVM